MVEGRSSKAMLEREQGTREVARSSVLDMNMVEDKCTRSLARTNLPLKLNRKPRAKTAKKIKVLMPSGPFVLDVVKLEADYKESPQHIDPNKGGFPNLHRLRKEIQRLLLEVFFSLVYSCTHGS